MQNENYQNAINPSHYNSGDISCWDAIVAAYGIEEAKIWAKITAFKYLWRLGKKDEVLQEIGKAKWYLDKLEKSENKTKEELKETTKTKSLLTDEEFNKIISNNKDEYYGN
jgi:hypothetical protein